MTRKEYRRLFLDVGDVVGHFDVSWRTAKENLVSKAGVLPDPMTREDAERLVTLMDALHETATNVVAELREVADYARRLTWG